MVEQDPVTSVHIVGLAVVDNRPQIKRFEILANKMEIQRKLITYFGFKENENSITSRENNIRI